MEGKNLTLSFTFRINKNNWIVSFPGMAIKTITKSEELKNTDLTQDQIDMMEKEIKQYEKDFISTSIKLKLRKLQERWLY